MRRIPSILVLILVIVSIVGISGGTRSGSSIYSSGNDSNIATNKSTEGIKVLSTRAHRDDKIIYTIDGEIQNNYNTEVENVKITGVGYDSNGNVVTTYTTFVKLDKIPPGGKSPFKLNFNDPNNEIVKYDLQMQPDPLELLLKDIKNILNLFGSQFILF